MRVFKHKRRSAHSVYSTTQSHPIPRPTDAAVTFKASSMGSAGEQSPAYYVDSVIAGASPDADAKVHGDAQGPFHEPLVMDFATMHDGINGSNAPLASPSSKADASWLSDDDTAAAAPPDISVRRDISHHVPLRTSSSDFSTKLKRRSLFGRSSRKSSLTPEPPATPHVMPETRRLVMPETPESQKSYPLGSSSSRRGSIGGQSSVRASSIGPNTMRSSADSVISLDSVAVGALPPLQQKNGLDDGDRLSPLLEDDPKSWDLVEPEDEDRKVYSLEARSEQLFSKSHLAAIFKDTPSLLRFTSFLSVARPESVPILIYYLDALKALRAINYSNAVAEALEPIPGLDFTDTQARPTVNGILEEKAKQAFDILVRDDLPAFITHIFTQVVSLSISKRVTGTLPPLLREASEGLAEVFCLTDPSRKDNPIIFASEEFHRTTQYGVSYAIGRNCRFLQGPKTNRSSVARFKEMCMQGKEHSEVFLNYRRDGSPFMNLLMQAPLLDSRGNLRYFIGAQIDVSGLAKDATDLDAFRHMLDEEDGIEQPEEAKDEFQELSEMFNHGELDTVRRFGGNMHRDHLEDKDDKSNGVQRPRLLIQDQSTFDIESAEKPPPKPEGRLSGPYKHYLLVRPAPSLRILFTSPSLRVPGILQSPFLDRIGGSNRVRESVRDALADGSRGVTAKIRWLPHAVQDLSNSYEEGRPRWIHCTPLLGANGSIGIWMIIIVDEEKHTQPNRRFRQAPPVANDVRRPHYAGAGGRNLNSRMDDLDQMGDDPRTVQHDDYGYSPGRVTSSYRERNGERNGGERNGTGAHRNMLLDAMRSPPSPRRSVNEQRAMNNHSNANSLRGNQYGSGASVDSFQI
ncbi:uncharacterized protein M421DRAFT_415262 [Didymella exigua CBS 183.55]|uniref:PAC domain-containing protein n=1 Tax=Didymella exigua CBS 183.55 TaxID=1150837 RepID=A0A6A5S6U5_9PLEO|nr:uncharacterized protein M421DRAFT_415262 [Didymella exigua CBS 183.55]KAF1934216.1 hypothetical protein M421DRAFT_415262 [Didymella exigua CBS 183.55]